MTKTKLIFHKLGSPIAETEFFIGESDDKKESANILLDPNDDKISEITKAIQTGEYYEVWTINDKKYELLMGQLLYLNDLDYTPDKIILPVGLKLNDAENNSPIHPELHGDKIKLVKN